MKRKILVLGTLLVTLLLCGCKASKYNNALDMYENQEYEDALSILLDIQDYKDSSELVISVLTEYVDVLAKGNKFDDAIYMLEHYSYLHDYSDKIAELTKEKEKYVKYCEAKEFLDNDQYEKGIEILKMLEDDYRNVKRIISSYDILQNSPFIGTHSVVAKASTGKQYKMNIKITLEYKNEEFYLNVYKTVKTMDGYLMSEKEYAISKSEIKNNTIKKEKYTWKIENGSLVETDSGSTYYYR